MSRDNREYNINQIVMPKWRFLLYRMSIYLKSIIKLLSEENTTRGRNYEFTTGWSGFNIKYQEKGYDSRAHIQIYFIWGKLFYKFGKHKEYITKEYDHRGEKQYGITWYKYGPSIMFYWGHRCKIYDMPWSLDWVRTSRLRQDGGWEHETPGNHRDDFHDSEKWGDILYEEQYDYRYVMKDGSIQNVVATITVVEREWRMKWFKYSTFNGKINKDIDVNFSSEIGERSGSYKGGVLGTSYKMIGNETPLETIRRMERDYKC